LRYWPSSPPTSGNPSADYLGVINDAAEFALWLSPHILANVGRVLATVVKTLDAEIDEYLQVLSEMAQASGGEITDPPQTVGDCAGWEDNRICLDCRGDGLANDHQRRLRGPAGRRAPRPC
jgi:hypothetical protein